MRDEQSQVFFFTACARARFNGLSVSSAKHHFCFSSSVTDQMCEHTRTFRDINPPRLQGRANAHATFRKPQLSGRGTCT